MKDQIKFICLAFGFYFLYNFPFVSSSMSSKFSNFSFSELFQTDSFNPEASIDEHKTNKSLLNITNNSSNISRYEEQKSMQKSREMDVVSRLYFLSYF